jgi:RNA polymerase sigma-70 factor (ECF subfamily)
VISTPCADTDTATGTGTGTGTPDRAFSGDGAEAGEPGESWDLVRAAQQGDTAAFAQLYDRYVDQIYRYLLFRVGTRELAEDLTSETFLRALRGITSVSYQGRDVGAWFVTIARNLLLDHVKSSRYRREITTAEVDTARPLVDPGPEQQVITTLASDILLRCNQPTRQRPARVHRSALPPRALRRRRRTDHVPHQRRTQSVAAPRGSATR